MKKHNNIKGMKAFFILWFSQSISTLGSSMTSFALILWVYQQKGTATSITLLAFFTYLPSVLFCFAAGTFADRWDKKKIMLVSDIVAAMGTVFVFVFYNAGTLEIWYLYIVNLIISFMNAFQNPASNAAVSLLAPKEQYNRASGMQSFSNSLTTILTPVLAGAVLAFGGLRTVLIIDLATFVFAFVMLSAFIHIPKVCAEVHRDGFWQSFGGGLRFLKQNKALLKIIAFFALINFFAYLTGYGILPALILARSGGDNIIMGSVSSAVGIGTLAGSIAVSLIKPPKSRTKVIFLACGISFLLCDIPWGISMSPVVWLLAGVIGNFPIPFLSANLVTIMRVKVPMAMQGRVFAARDTLQFFTIPLGLLLSGTLADHVFEPLMAGTSLLRNVLSFFVGSGKGSGMAVMFLMTGVLGVIASFTALKSKEFRSLDED